MTVPLVAELSACTSEYGRLAPLPPVAPAAAAAVLVAAVAVVAADPGGAARARSPATVSEAVPAATAVTRPRFRMDWNTECPFRAPGRSDPVTPLSAERGETEGVDRGWPRPGHGRLTTRLAVAGAPVCLRACGRVKLFDIRRTRIFSTSLRNI